ncbi:hypothetical protein I3843_09G055300 [Carya illinoinensis]|nr:hypothetical protein I3843_09G055300 [Carya illinoinensis]
MFDILFGWNKASKCKKLVKRVQCRLKILKKRRCSIVRHLREDIAQLLKNGQDESAFARVEQLFKDESLLAAYDLLEHFCGFIIIHCPYIRRHKDCPNDVKEAVSTLVFAAAWFGDLPELQIIRKLFGERYGHIFTKPSVDMCPGSLVNQEIRKKLSISSVPHEVKLRLINEIAIDYSLHLGQLGYGNKHKQVMQLSGKHDCEWEGFGFEGETGETQVNDNTESGVHALVSYANVVPTNASSRENHEYLYEPKRFPSNVSCQRNDESFCSEALSAASNDNRVKIGQTATSSEISFQFHRRSIVYLDEIQEFQFGVQDDTGEDKRIFIFNPTILPCKRNNGVHRAGSFVSSQLESCESVTTIPETKHKRACPGDHFKRVKTSWKWWKRRSDFEKSHSDQSCPSPALSRNHDARDQLSYSSTCKFSPSKKCLYHRFFPQIKHWRRMPAQEARSSSYKFHEKSLSHQQLEVHGKCTHNHRSSNCIIKDKFDWESSSWRQKRGMAALAGFSIHHFSLEKCLQVWNSPPKNPWGKNSKMASQADPVNKKSNQLGGAEVSDCLTGGASSQESCSKASNRHAEPERFARTTCSGTMANSLERPKSTTSSSHVHPKLPDYDQLAAKFRALKQDYLQRTSAITSGLNIALA